jgi:hypothetical protein
MRTMRRVMTAGLALAMVLGVSAAPTSAQDAPPATGFATPEDAVREYLEGVAAADIDRVLATAAIDEMAEGFDFVAYIDRLKAWLSFQAPAPATDPFLVELNRAQLTGQLLLQTRMLIYSLLTSEDLEGGTLAPVDAAWATDFMAQLDLTRLAPMEVIEVAAPEPDLLASERYLENAAKQAAMHGADEHTERVALISLGGQTGIVGFTLLRHGDSWGISTQSSPIAGLPVFGAAQPISLDEWQELTTPG